MAEPRRAARTTAHRGALSRSLPQVLFVVLVAACDTPPPSSPIDMTPIDDAEPVEVDVPDASIRLPPGAPCDADVCARGACADGVCSALCARDADCDPATPLCVGRGGAGRCSATCRSAGDCAAGLICAVVDVDVGICVAPGPGSAGAACAGREDCASWFCSAGVCSGRCDDDVCDDGARCLSLHTQSVCVEAGAGEPEAPCAADGDCASAVCRGGRCADVCPDGTCGDDRICVRFPTANLCERRCADSGDCGPTGVCALVGRQRLCVTRGLGEAGMACSAHAGCASGRCDLGACAAVCDDGLCPAGQACVVDIAGATCRPAGPAPAGARCDRGDVCASGVCGGGICTADCAEGPCPDGARCVRFADGAFCFPDCADDADCPSPSFCDAGFDEGPICFWRGAGAAGAACTSDRACRSGRCADGRCLQACTAECPAELRCVSVGTGRFCVSPPLPLGAACDAVEGCAEGLQCTAGRCLPACAEGCPGGSACLGERCHPMCDADADCRPGRVCPRLGARVCVDVGPTPIGGACDDGAACADGLCLGGICQRRCGAGCEEDETCLDLSGDRWCVPAGPEPTGAMCIADADCAAGLCYGRRCAGPCPDDGCPAGTVCDDALGPALCLGACSPERPCAEGEVCDLARGGLTGRCVEAPTPSAVGVECDAGTACGPGTVGCVDGADGPRCRAPCRVGTGDCLAGQSCAPISSQGGEVGACVPSGPRSVLDPCEAGGECGSGWCVLAYLGGRCGQPCGGDDDCGADRCVDLARDPAAPLRVCAVRCTQDVECAAPLRCRRSLDGDGACY